ncbi:hypothetical protein ASG97_12925 [Bacillus sp. Soil745]|nr:hypothetical protein ASG97_12925 [Bacillus sp. Soil745]
MGKDRKGFRFVLIICRMVWRKGGLLVNLIFVPMDKMMEISLSPKISISVRSKIIYNRLGSKKRPTGH